MAWAIKNSQRCLRVMARPSLPDGLGDQKFPTLFEGDGPAITYPQPPLRADAIRHSDPTCSDSQNGVFPATCVALSQPAVIWSGSPDAVGLKLPIRERELGRKRTRRDASRNRGAEDAI